MVYHVILKLRLTEVKVKKFPYSVNENSFSKQCFSLKRFLLNLVNYVLSCD